MSEYHTLTNTRHFLIALDDSEFSRIEAGELVTKVFHPLWLLPSHELRVLIGKNVPDESSPAIRQARKNGVSFARFPVTPEIVAEWEGDRTVPSAKYGDFEVTIGLKRGLEAALR